MATLAVLGKGIGKTGSRKVTGGLFSRARLVVSSKVTIVSCEALDETFEDAQLNVIADERAEGPFVKVTLGG